MSQTDHEIRGLIVDKLWELHRLHEMTADDLDDFLAPIMDDIRDDENEAEEEDDESE